MRCLFGNKNAFSSRSTVSPPGSVAATPPLEESSSQDQTPRSRSQASSSTITTTTTIVDLTLEYSIAVQTSSYNEIWEKMHHLEQIPSSHHLDQVLHPDRGSIEQILERSRPTHLTRLVSSYFDTSEHTSNLCLLLHRSIHRARALYSPLQDLLDILPPSSPSPSSSSHFFSSQSQFDWAFDILSAFDRHENPFPSDSNFHDMRLSFSQLKHQLDRRLRKARHRHCVTHYTTCSSAICLIGTTLGIAISAIVIATHALAALVAAPFFLSLPTNISKQQLNHIAQLDAAARGTYVLNNDLDTIDRLVARLHATIESDKRFVRLGLERGKDQYPIQEVVKQLRRNHPNFLYQLKDLEEHVCLCFATVNRARSLLLQEINLHQTSNSQQHLCFNNCNSPHSFSSCN